MATEFHEGGGVGSDISEPAVMRPGSAWIGLVGESGGVWVKDLGLHQVTKSRHF
jgi:hypothetical protein